MAGRGAPVGNTNATKSKPWLAALERHGAQNPNKLAKIAAAVYDAACNGEAWAVQEIGNRLDGKPVQPVDVKDDRQQASLSNAYLEFIAAGRRPDEWTGETVQ